MSIKPDEKLDVVTVTVRVHLNLNFTRSEYAVVAALAAKDGMTTDRYIARHIENHVVNESLQQAVTDLGLGQS